MNINNLDKNTQEKINHLPFNTEKARKDITGKVYGRLTVLGRGEDYISPGGHKSSQWWCICDCPAHNIILVRISNLTSGNTKSCGCLNEERILQHLKNIGHAHAKDITNQQFGELIALRPTEQRKGNSIVWECICSCGKKHYVACNELTSHRIESCGHSKESRGVRKIKQLLEDNHIYYITEKTFKDCKFPDSKVSARFDFYINNEFVLEYDGEQHFQQLDTNFFKDSLEKRKQHDEYKNQWCKEHNILLKRIPYYDVDNITLDSIMGDKYLV